MPPYTPTDYLLDRANIHDTVLKLYLYNDRHQWDKLDSIIAPQMVLDYTAMFGGEPRTVTAADLVETWKPVLTKLSSSQHVMSSVLIYLPQPGSTEEEVDRAKVDANVIVNLVRKGFEGGEWTSNGGIMELEVVRVSKDPALGNPWRISKIKANPAWSTGNTRVLMD
jgi:SnoaL-like domain